MKTKLLTICCLFAVLFAGCKKQTVVVQESVIQNRQVLDFEANNSHWVLSNGAYYATFDVPELTKDAYDNAVLLCYAEFNTGSNNAYQEMLPFTYFDQSVDPDTGVIFNWSRLLDFDYTVGSFTVYYTNNDFNYLEGEPGTWHFRLVFLW